MPANIVIYIKKVLRWTLAILLVGMIALVFTNVVLRYGFSSSLRQSVELSRMWLVWLVMLGAVTVLLNNDHLAVSEFVEAAFPKAMPILTRLKWAVILLCSCMLMIGCYRQTMSNLSNFSQITGLPTALFYLPGVISGFLMAAISFVRFFKPTAFENQ